jgi:hypothetical protein
VKDDVREVQHQLYLQIFSDFGPQSSTAREIGMPPSTFYKQTEGHADIGGRVLAVGLRSLPPKQLRKALKRLLDFTDAELRALLLDDEEKSA